MQLFKDKETAGEIELIYSSNVGLPGLEIGESIIGMSRILQEVAVVLKVSGVEVIVFPPESGSFKSVFRYVAKNRKTIIIETTAVVTLLNQSFGLIQNFGINTTFHQSKPVIDAAQNAQVVELCGSRLFAEGASKVLLPLKEQVRTVKIKADDKSFEVHCEDRSKFFEPLDDSGTEILPELVNGNTYNLDGGISRINKEWNEIGFRYQGIALKAVPYDSDAKVTMYHDLIPDDQVTLRAIVIRNSNYEKPELRIISMQSAQQKLFGKQDQ